MEVVKDHIFHLVPLYMQMLAVPQILVLAFVLLISLLGAPAVVVAEPCAQADPPGALAELLIVLAAPVLAAGALVVTLE
jgi:hypothetical protein